MEISENMPEIDDIIEKMVENSNTRKKIKRLSKRRFERGSRRLEQAPQYTRKGNVQGGKIDVFKKFEDFVFEN